MLPQTNIHRCISRSALQIGQVQACTHHPRSKQTCFINLKFHWHHPPTPKTENIMFMYLLNPHHNSVWPKLRSWRPQPVMHSNHPQVMATKTVYTIIQYKIYVKEEFKCFAQLRWYTVKRPVWYLQQLSQISIKHHAKSHLISAWVQL